MGVGRRGPIKDNAGAVGIRLTCCPEQPAGAGKVIAMTADLKNRISQR
jgi:hypothetical protein